MPDEQKPTRCVACGKHVPKHEAPQHPKDAVVCGDCQRENQARP